MAKILYVRNNENTEWVEIASAIPDIPDISTFASIDYVDNEINNIDALPSQIGNDNKFLTTSGSVASWATVDLTSAINTASAAAVTYLVDSAPATLDTLNELAAALGDDENFATTVTNSLSNKLDTSVASSTYATNDSLSNKLDISVASSTYATKDSPTFTGLVNNAAGANIASATAVDLTSATGNTVVITGTTPVTSLVMNTGQQMILLPSGALPLTFHATNMNINGNNNYTCIAGDRLYCVKDLAGVIRVSVIKQGSPFSATGGTITTSGAYTIHTFTTSGTFTPLRSGTVDYLVVAGGGGGGQNPNNNTQSGGGGAGGLRTSAGVSGGGGIAETIASVLAQGYTITIGGGGAGALTNTRTSSNGGNSSIAGSGFTTISSTGGGAASSVNSAGNAWISPIIGGSGGGAGSGSTTGANGTANQGYAGGNADGTYGGGGGGAGGVGASSVASAAGGIGVESSISGSSLTYSEGGIGGVYGGTPGTAGTTNRGNGGMSGGVYGGGAGGSGIVIIRYLT